jgi:hypothetical protein
MPNSKVLIGERMMRFDGGRGSVEGGGGGMYQSTSSAKVFLEPVF